MIPRNWLGRSSQFLLLSPLTLVWVFRVGIGDLAVAQVSADSSVGTTVTTNGLTYEITEGTTVGDTNLFHSFSSFTIPRGWSADFLNAPTITNILVRVTGDTPSDIQGQLRAQGSANLFLMNPNGIQFGSGARLRIGGSFVGTTASAIGFPGGGEFSITSQVEPQNSLLKVNPSALLFNQIAVQPITNQFAALQVPRGRSLLLLGGNVNLDGGRLQTLDGRVELGGLVGAGMVELEIDSNNLRLSFPQGVQRADVSLTNGAIVSASNTSTGGGNIQIQGKRITLTEGSEIRVNTLGSQPGGTLAVTASELVELTGGSRLLRDTVNTGAAGALRIETKRLIVQDGSQVSASTLSEGQGGTLAVTASESIELNGTSANGDPSGLFVVAQDIGVAGDIEIETGRLVVRDGAQVSASTLSEGQGGRLTLTASESIQLTGTSANGQSRSGLFVGTTGTGVAGDLKIETGQLTVSDGAVVSARTSSLGNGGNITLQVRDLLQLRGNSQISTAAGIPGTGGNGGNINIDAKLIVAIPGENSDIIANAFEGNGGNINITTQGIFGIQFREELTPLSDINASSEFGVNGIVQINTPDIDPSRGLTNLPAEVVDSSNQIDQTCSAGRGEAGKNKFIVTGRRGLPSNPYEMLSNEQALEDIHPPEGFSSRKNSNPDAARSFTSQSATSNPKPPIVEVQGWMINDKGQVVLTATASTSTPHNSWLRSATCPSS
jgi:filamentous hemagglutinin family protein